MFTSSSISCQKIFCIDLLLYINLKQLLSCWYDLLPKLNINLASALLQGFSLHKTGSGFWYLIFSKLAEKNPYDLILSQLAGKSKFKKVNFPYLAKYHVIFPQFKEKLELFSQFHWHQKFPQKTRGNLIFFFFFQK